jgi:4-hydroxy-tetrahydrodipicolinate synthase
VRAKETWLWTAIITPFTADASGVDFETFAALLKRQEAAGNGVMILGSTGESLSLSEDEKKEIVRFTFAQKLKVPVMVGTPNVNLTQTLAWIDFCKGCGAEGYLAATPVYTKPAAQGQIDWFRAILDAVDAPVMLYNVPSRTGSTLSPEVLRALAKHKNFWAVKESSGGLDMYIEYAAAAPDVALYCGDDNLMVAAASIGACGLVSVASNMWPDACNAYVKACRDGSYRGQEWWRIGKSLFATTSPVPLKSLMHERGILPNPAVRLPLSVKDFASLDGVKVADQAVTEWFGRWTSTREGKAA